MALNYRRGVRRLYLVYFVVVCAAAAWLTTKGALQRELDIHSLCVGAGHPFEECGASLADDRYGVWRSAWIEAGVWIAVWGVILPLIAYALSKVVRWLIAGFKSEA